MPQISGFGKFGQSFQAGPTFSAYSHVGRSPDTWSPLKISPVRKKILVARTERVSIRPMRTSIIIPLLLALFQCLAAPLIAVVVNEAPFITPTENSVTMKWGTDAECGTLLKLGLNKNALTRKVEGEVGTKHQVQANELLPGTEYFYTIGTSKKPLLEGSFTTKGKSPKGTPPPPAPAAKQETKSAPKPAEAPAAKPTYTPPPTSKTWGDKYSLQDHFNRHGADFGAKNPDDYAAKAWLFLQRAMDEGLPAKQDTSDGTIRVWDGKSHSFAAYNSDFTTKTYFKPNSGDYFTRQPGKPVRLRHAPPKS